MIPERNSSSRTFNNAASTLHSVRIHIRIPVFPSCSSLQTAVFVKRQGLSRSCDSVATRNASSQPTAPREHTVWSSSRGAKQAKLYCKCCAMRFLDGAKQTYDSSALAVPLQKVLIGICGRPFCQVELYSLLWFLLSLVPVAYLLISSSFAKLPSYSSRAGQDEGC